MGTMANIDHCLAAVRSPASPPTKITPKQKSKQIKEQKSYRTILLLPYPDHNLFIITRSSGVSEPNTNNQTNLNLKP